MTWSQGNRSQGYGPQGYGPQGPAPAPGGPRVPGIGARLIAFLTRDIAALVAAAVTIISGLILLVTPSLAWIRDTSNSLVEGTMSVSARGSVSLSTLAERGLSESDAFELGLMELGIQTILGPFAGMLMLSALLVMVGGVLMLTTARQLGAVVALMGVIPQIVVVAIGLLTAVVFDDSSSTPSPPAGPSPAPDSGMGAGAGFYVTIIVYVLVIACAALAALRPERGRGPSTTTSGPTPYAPTGQQFEGQSFGGHQHGGPEQDAGQQHGGPAQGSSEGGRS